MNGVKYIASRFQNLEAQNPLYKGASMNEKTRRNLQDFALGVSTSDLQESRCDLSASDLRDLRRD